MTVSAPATHNTAETRFVEAAGIAFAYRRFGRPAGLPVVLLQHFNIMFAQTEPSQAKGGE
jgi:hypothetical protein